jgi:hypothetical protein
MGQSLLNVKKKSKQVKHSFLNRSRVSKNSKKSKMSSTKNVHEKSREILVLDEKTMKSSFYGMP